MTERERVEDSLATAGSGVESRMKEAVEKILALVWDARSDKFAFADNPDVDAEVNRILAQMSDGMLEEARTSARNLLKSLDFDEWEDDALEAAEREIGDETTLFRFDMQASHLKQLLESWIIVAAVYGLSRSRVWIDLKTYLTNPMASRLWRGAGRGPMRWGRGYVNNLIEAYRRLIRDYLHRAYLYAQLNKYAEEGAIGYTIHRGSTYDCPLCDSYTGMVWPLDAEILPIHVNCMCYTEPVFREEI